MRLPHDIGNRDESSSIQRVPAELFAGGRGKAVGVATAFFSIRLPREPTPTARSGQPPPDRME